jgi:hypothetical protein
MYYIVWGMVYTKQSCLLRLRVGLCKTKQIHHVGDGLCEAGLLAMFGSWIMQNKAVCFVLGLVYMRQGCWHCLGDSLHEMKPPALIVGWVTWDRALGIVCGLVYVKQSCLLHLGVGLCEMKLLALFGSWVT